MRDILLGAYGPYMAANVGESFFLREHVSE